MGGYVSPGLGPRRTRSIADLILRRGDIAAQRAMGSGQIWGNALSNIGQMVGGVIQQRAEKKDKEARAEAFGQLMEDPKMMEDPRYAMNSLVQAGYEPPEAFQFARGFKMFADSMKEQEMDPTKALPYARELAGIYMNADAPTQQRLQPVLAQWAGHAGLDPEGTLGQLGQEEFTSTVKSFVEPGEGADEQFTLSPGAARYDAEGNLIAERDFKPEPEKKWKITDRSGVTRLVPESELEKGIQTGAPGGTGGGKMEYFLDTETGRHVLRTPEEARADEERYRRPLWAAQGTELEKVQRNLAAFDDIETSLEAVTDKVGPGTYTLNEMRQQIPERWASAQPAFRAFQQQLNALTNEEIKRITGAQMSEPEAARLKKGMADGTLKLDDLRAALYIWKRTMQMSRASLMGRLDKWQEENPYDPERANLFGSGEREPDEGMMDKAIGWVTSFFSGDRGGAAEASPEAEEALLSDYGY